MSDEIERGKQYEQDEATSWPSPKIRFYAEETQERTDAIFGTGKTHALDRLLRDMLGRKVEITDLKADPELSGRLDAKREEIERDLPGLFAEMQGAPHLSPSQWEYGDRVIDGTGYTRRRRGISYMDVKLRDRLSQVTPEQFPVQVGDVVRVINIMEGGRPVPGHVVDIDGSWILVSGPLGRKQPFFGHTGFRAGEYRWRLEPYITEEESNR